MRSRTLLFIFLIAAVCVPAKARRKPVIGISTGCSSIEYSIVRRSYSDAVLRAGGIPFLLPQVSDSTEAEEILRRIDGIIFTGGEDISPAYYGEKVYNGTVKIDSHRDTLDMLYAKAALARRIPILGICRGEQLMNVVLGGSLYQDLPSQKPGKILHNQTLPDPQPSHAVIVIDRNSLLRKLAGKDTIYVNSFHHQAVKVPSSKVTVTALSEDGVVEGFESISRKQWLLAVQFHPELLSMSDDSWLDIFRSLVKAARR